jgi:hypothetical protein
MERKRVPHLAQDKLAVDYDDEDFKISLPHLYNELNDKDHWARVPIEKIEHDGLVHNLDQSQDIEGLPADDILTDDLEEDEEIREDLLDSIPTEESHGFCGDLEYLEDDLGNSSKNIPLKELSEEEERELCFPGPLDFLRRCHSDKDAIEIIEYLLNRGEISSEEADELKSRINTQGIQSFGPKKTWGYFERKYRRNFTEENSE